MPGGRLGMFGSHKRNANTIRLLYVVTGVAWKRSRHDAHASISDDSGTVGKPSTLVVLNQRVGILEHVSELGTLGHGSEHRFWSTFRSTGFWNRDYRSRSS